VFIVDAAVVSVIVMTATRTLLVKHRSSTYNYIKSTLYQLLKRHRHQTKLLIREYLNHFFKRSINNKKYDDPDIKENIMDKNTLMYDLCQTFLLTLL
jgi:hypothetical protein